MRGKTEKHVGSNRNRTVSVSSRKGACGKVRGEASKLIDLVMASEIVPAISVFSGLRQRDHQRVNSRDRRREIVALESELVRQARLGLSGSVEG